MTPVGEVFERFPRAGARPGPATSASRSASRWKGEEIELDRVDSRRARRSAAAPDPERGGSRASSRRTSGSAAGSRPRDASCSRPPASGTASPSGSSDDGRGIDRGADPGQGASARGVVGAEVEIADATTCCSGCSRGRDSAPRQAVSGVSGRGVGVDVAMTRVRALGGTLEIRERAGAGDHVPDPGAAHAGHRAGAAGRGRGRALRRAAGLRGRDGGVRPCARSRRCGTARRWWCGTR